MRMIFIIPVTLLLFCGCISKTERNNSSQMLIDELLIKYPQLGITDENKKASFELTRLVKDKKYRLEFEWYESAENAAGIIVIKDSSNSYAVPLFESSQYDYWQEDSSYYKDVSLKVNTTFEGELKTVARKLKVKSQFLFFRYLFEHVLLLRESCVPNAVAADLPMEANYEGRYIISMTVYKTRPDSISIIGRFPAVL